MKTTFTHTFLAAAFVLAAGAGALAQTNTNTDVSASSKDGKTTVHIRKVEMVNGVEKVTDTTYTTTGDVTINNTDDLMTIDEKKIDDMIENMIVLKAPGEEGSVSNGTARISISGDKALTIDGKKMEDMVKKMVTVREDKDGVTTEIKIDEAGIEALVNSALAEAGIDTSNGQMRKTIVVNNRSKTKNKSDEKNEKTLNKTMTIRVETKADGARATANGTTQNNTASGTTPNTLDVKDLNFWPNPNDGKFKLRFSLEDKADAMLTIYDTAGKQVYSEKLPRFRGEYNKNIDISGNEKGVYFVRIEQDGRALVKKIILQ